MSTRTETREEFEARLIRQSEDADAGAYDHIFDAMLDDLISSLPEGYGFENGRIVRLDPSLPDHVYVEAKANGIPTGRQVRLVAF